MVRVLVEKDSRPPPALPSPILLKLPKDLRNGHLVKRVQDAPSLDRSTSDATVTLFSAHAVDTILCHVWRGPSQVPDQT